MINLHWTIVGGNLLPDDSKQMNQLIQITLRHQNNEEEAITAAKKLISRDHFYLTTITECDCFVQNKRLQDQVNAVVDMSKSLHSDND